MAIALVSHGIYSNGGSNSNGFTTPGQNTTGATLLVVAYAEALGSAGVISDSNGNTWHQLSLDGLSQVQVDIWYAYDHGGSALVVGAGHTVTSSGTATFPSIGFTSWSGTDTTAAVFDGQNGGTTTFANSVATGSVTPSAANALVFACNATNDPTGLVVSGGSLAMLDINPNSSFGTCGSGVAYVIQTTAGAVNGTFTETNSSGQAAAIAVFKAAAGGGGGTDTQEWMFRPSQPRPAVTAILY